jgi:rare lipoprotein A
MRYLFLLLISPLLISFTEIRSAAPTSTLNSPLSKKTFYGIASYYADKFNGRPTASGEIYSHQKLTAACNILPLGTWVKVTNLRNNKFVIVKTNDRLHPRMKRIVDLSKSAAQALAYTGRGLTQVKVEVIEKNRKSQAKEDK